MNEGSTSNSGGIIGFLDFGFTKFVTLKAIKVLYALGLVLLILGWLGFSLISMTQNFFAGLGILFLGAIGVVVYGLLFRIQLELIAVIFRIGENTSKLVQQMEKNG